MDVGSLIENLESSDAFKEFRAPEQLIELGKDAVEPLIVAMRAGEGKKCWRAAKITGRISDERVVPALIESLDSPNPMLKGMAIDVLGNVPDQRACLPLLRLLPIEEPHIQVAIIQVLMKLADSSSLDALLALLANTESSTVRYTVIEALGELGNPRAIEAILYFKDDQNHHVRRRVDKALKKIGGDETFLTD